MTTRTTLHVHEPQRPTDRRPFASFSVVDRDSDRKPFVALTIGDERGEQVVIFAHDPASLRRIEEAVGDARRALEGEQPIRVRL